MPDRIADLDVSRETLERLRIYQSLLERWNPRINLVAPSTLSDAWSRHFEDSAQLWHLLPPQAARAIDFGSGAGFPALVLATLAREQRPSLTFHLVESDARKAAFLNTVARDLGLAASVHISRLEATHLPRADVVTARAFASLHVLIGHAMRLRAPDGVALFPKGRTVHKELDEARRLWNFDYRLHPSLTDPEAAVVEIGAIYGPS